MIEMENAKQVLGFIGILFRANKLQIGSYLWHSMSEVKLFVKAKDADSGEAMRYEKKIRSAHLPLLVVDLSKEELGEAVGRDAVTFIGITDKKAALAFVSKVK